MRFRNTVCSLPVLCLHPTCILLAPCLHPPCSLPASRSLWELWDAAGDGFVLLPTLPHEPCHLCFSCPACAFLCLPLLSPNRLCPSPTLLYPWGARCYRGVSDMTHPTPPSVPVLVSCSICESHEQLCAQDLPLCKTGAVLCGDTGGKIILASGKVTAMVNPRGSKAVGGLGGARLRLCELRAQFAAGDGHGGEGGSVVTLSPLSLQSPSTCAATSAAASTPMAQPRASMR